MYEGVTGSADEANSAGIGGTGTMWPDTAFEDETEEALECVRSRGIASLLDPDVDGVRNARLEGYLRKPGNGGNPLSLSSFCCAGPSSGVLGIGRLVVDAVDGVSTMSLPDLACPLASVDRLEDPNLESPSRGSSGMLRVRENDEPTLLVLARPFAFADCLCQEVGGNEGRALEPGLRWTVDTSFSSSS